MTTNQSPTQWSGPISRHTLKLKSVLEGLQQLTPRLWRLLERGGAHWSLNLLVCAPVALTCLYGLMFTAPLYFFFHLILFYIEGLFIAPLMWIQVTGLLMITAFIGWLLLSMAFSSALGLLIVVGGVIAIVGTFSDQFS